MPSLRGAVRRVRTTISGYRHTLRPIRPAASTLARAVRADYGLIGFLDSIRSGEPGYFFFDSASSSDLARQLEVSDPGWKERIVEDGRRIESGEFRVLGAGVIELGRPPLPWHEDAQNRYAWNPRTYYKNVEIPYDRADIKFPWELSRFQHLPTLGMAYVASGDERYVGSVMAHIDDWISANPPGYGVNWACAMDVAIRAINWLWALQFIRAAPDVTDDFLIRLGASLLAHGRHVAGNIERYEGGVTTNHTLADYTGLLYLGLLLPALREAETWVQVGLEGVAECMATQVTSDGVDFENSISYHRLVLEMFAGSYILTQRNGYVFPSTFRSSLERMFEFVYHYTRPDGLAPLVGDSDDGRLQILSRYFDWDPQDHRYLLGVGAALFDRDDFASLAREAPGAAVETTLLLGSDAWLSVKSRSVEPSRSSMAFAASGRYVFRDDDHFAFLSADEVGSAGLGNHKHNDIFSFELTVSGVTMIVDAGSFLYTSDRAARDAFRSTRAHNTLMVDGVEQNESLGPFGMRRDAHVRVIDWRSGDEFDHFDALHTGYERLAEPLTHRRRVWFSKAEFALLVIDTLDGSGEHDVESWLHLAEGAHHVGVSDREGLARRARGMLNRLIEGHKTEPTPIPNVGGALGFRRGPIGIVVVPLAGIKLGTEAGWIAPRYGRRVEAPAVRYAERLLCPASFGYLILER